MIITFVKVPLCTVTYDTMVGLVESIKAAKNGLPSFFALYKIITVRVPGDDEINTKSYINNIIQLYTGSNFVEFELKESVPMMGLFQTAHV